MSFVNEYGYLESEKRRGKIVWLIKEDCKIYVKSIKFPRQLAGKRVMFKAVVLDD